MRKPIPLWDMTAEPMGLSLGRCDRLRLGLVEPFGDPLFRPEVERGRSEEQRDATVNRLLALRKRETA